MLPFLEQIYHKKSLSGLTVAFLDRDGTIIQSVSYLHKKTQIQFLPGVVEGLQVFQKKNIAMIIITNQPVVARGLATIEEVAGINDEIVLQLAEYGITISAIYSCPHHPNADIVSYKGDCLCRKPNTAMFERAIENFTIDKKKIFMIGDSMRDVGAGKRLGIHTYFLTHSSDTRAINPDYVCTDLLAASKIIVTHPL